MTSNRRLGVVGAALALMAAVSSSQVWGDGDRKSQGQPITSGSRVSQDKADRQFADPAKLAA